MNTKAGKLMEVICGFLVKNLHGRQVAFPVGISSICDDQESAQIWNEWVAA